MGLFFGIRASHSVSPVTIHVRRIAGDGRCCTVILHWSVFVWLVGCIIWGRSFSFYILFCEHGAATGDKGLDAYLSFLSVYT
jgi:hypothetical protein